MLAEDEKIRLTRMAGQMRRYALTMARGRSSHFGGGLSPVDVLAVLYGKVMRHDAHNPEWKDRDRFILSKGHGVLGYYAALAAAGYIPESDLAAFEETGTYLAGHPIKNRPRGMEFTTGSLGMGLGLGVGVALAIRKRGGVSRVYVLLGDGELNEGSVWEAMMSAAQFRLGHLTAVVDHNGLQLGGPLTEIMNPRDIAAKARAFGWEAAEVDGHDIEAVYNALTRERHPERPFMVVASTRKGKGFSFSENSNDWHHAVLTQPRYEEAMAELGDER